jgi:hypothetical protein
VRTTIRIDDDLYRSAKARAALTGRSVGELIEDAVRVALVREQEQRPSDLPGLPVYGGTGLLPGVDINDSRALNDLLDADVGHDALR